MHKSTIHRGKSAILFSGEPGSVKLFWEQKPMRVFGDERRAVERFPIRMNLRYRLSRKGQGTTSEASGRVVNISSTGILFDPGLSHPEGAVVVLSIDWPVHHDRAVPIKLLVVGMVVRSDDRGTAISILRHGFEPWQDWPGLSEAPEAKAAVGEEPPPC